MTELLTAAQMRAIEHAAINAGAVTGLDLMERAGRGVLDAIFEEWPGLASDAGLAGGQPPDPRDISAQKKQRRRAVVLCGPGNNGGDGFVVARLLKEAKWDVTVYLYGDAGRLPPDAGVNYARWIAMGEVHALSDVDPPEFAYHDLVIDALFGTGLTRPLAGLGHVLRDLCNCVDAGAGRSLQDRLPHWPPVVAVDLPSGVCSDSGRVLALEEFTTHGGARAACAVADLTVTFHARKLGQMLVLGPEACGRITCVDIGIVPPASRAIPVAQIVRQASAGGAQVRRQGHKYDHGHALCLCGGVGSGGAARLAARAALRVGAGAVTLGCPPAALIENAARLDAVMLRRVDDAAVLVQVLADKRINVICLGPGLGTGTHEAALLVSVLGEAEPRAVVLDADALTLLARDPALFDRLHDRCVLTPHAGEFARLFPDIAAKLDAPATSGPAYSKVDATREAAKRAGCVVLFKGPDTVIADRSGRSSVNASAHDRSAPWLATAGSGDVLAGFITGLLARGFTPLQAAESGAWLHTECAVSFGPGLIAEDLADELPKVFRTLGV